MNLKNWFMGVVEDESDPLEMGRVKVRCYGYHTPDRELLPSEDLPWTQTIYPVTSGPANRGNGTGPTSLLNSIVFGVFYDGDDRQTAIVFGVLPGPAGDKPPQLNQFDAETGNGFGVPVPEEEVPPQPMASTPAFGQTRGITSTAIPDRSRIQAKVEDYPDSPGNRTPTSDIPSGSEIGNNFSRAAEALSKLPPSRDVENTLQIGNTAFRVTTETRDQLANSSSDIGNRNISLDYNAGGGDYVMIVIPDDSTDIEIAAAQEYVDQVEAFYRRNGINVGTREGGGVVKRSDNIVNGKPNGVPGFFHTEPGFVDSRKFGNAQIKLLEEKSDEYAQIVANTLGTIPGAKFIAPHRTNEPGAGGPGVLGERPFARKNIIPELEKIRSELPISQISQIIIDQGIYENEEEQPIDPESGKVIQTAEKFFTWATTRGQSGITVNSGSKHSVQNGSILINKSMFGAPPKNQKGLIVTNPSIFAAWDNINWGGWICFNLERTGVSPAAGLPKTELKEQNKAKTPTSPKGAPIYYGPEDFAE